jgi:hypothetical protein
MSTPQTITVRESEIEDDPGRLVREMKAGNTVNLKISGIDYTVAPTSAIVRIGNFIVMGQELDDAEAEDMVSVTTEDTGVDNVVFVSTKGNARHAARIKIAVDPPNSLNAAGTNASMAIHDYGLTGAYLAPHIVEQAKRFIDRNRDVLLRYWDCEISTKQMIEGLAPPPD